MRRFLANWRVVAVALVVLAVLAAALWPETVEVDVTRAKRGPLSVTLDEEGETRVRERFVVSAPVTGRLHRIELEPGDPVIRHRTVLARLTPAPPTLLDARLQAELGAGVEVARAALGQARAESERSAAALSRAQSLLRRQQALAEGGLTSKDELEAAQTAFRTAAESQKAAEFSVSRAEYDLKMAGARLQAPQSGGRPIEIVAPIDGVVLKRWRESESVVPVGEPLIEIGDAERLEVVADLLSSDAVRVAAGARVLLEQWGGGHALDGRVRRVEPSGFMKVSALGVEEQRVNIIIDFTDPATAATALGDSYRVEVRIVVWEADDVLTVPAGSVFRSGPDWAVFTIESGRVRTRKVKVGQRNATDVQILEGLEVGQQIVLYPPDTLRDGVRITVRP